ncbi:hypothetical protein QU487_15775 [Crenobacter sp. SG2305]|uniref:hypothetical protein n=1 Tax=Crenobacter oryzisoli TaxID=3056844 RepID=UPI0025AAF5C5|nr:hypothetical protein [Crenobacter sp. SG2305]MDN0084200.1 hypothetical protein [Crenobacter sp. SG2305]
MANRISKRQCRRTSHGSSKVGLVGRPANNVRQTALSTKKGTGTVSVASLSRARITSVLTRNEDIGRLDKRAGSHKGQRHEMD